jgi:SpoVK/Ycf46/Vps4 family AAA+-type ATPase
MIVQPAAANFLQFFCLITPYRHHPRAVSGTLGCSREIKVTMSTSEDFSDTPLILPYQRPIYERLSAVARACLNVDRKQFSAIKLRTCFLIIGPTGTGKTFLAHQIARELSVPFLTVTTSDWIVLGANHRGSSTTWPTIYKFLSKNKNSQGAIIFIDELDKCRDESNWNSFLRSEIFSLCDARIPLGINDLDWDDDKENLTDVANFLRNKVMIIGGAAFQGVWDERSAPTVGFNPTPPESSMPELNDLSRILPRELINRFSSEIFMLPQITDSDYIMMVEAMAHHVPDTWRKRFLDLGRARIDQAVRNQRGARYIEEILLTAIVEQRAELANFVPQQDAPSHSLEITDGDLSVS